MKIMRLKVLEFASDSNASKIGLEIDDLLESLNEIPLESVQHLASLLSTPKEAELVFLRNGARMSIRFQAAPLQALLQPLEYTVDSGNLGAVSPGISPNPPSNSEGLFVSLLLAIIGWLALVAGLIVSISLANTGSPFFRLPAQLIVAPAMVGLVICALFNGMANGLNSLHRIATNTEKLLSK